jgi:hypothetical protein
MRVLMVNHESSHGLDCADDVGVPFDPEFRSARIAYLEWGARLAVLNSQLGAAAVEDAPMPRWGLGRAGWTVSRLLVLRAHEARWRALPVTTVNRKLEARRRPRLRDVR